MCVALITNPSRHVFAQRSPRNKKAAVSEWLGDCGLLKTKLCEKGRAACHSKNNSDGKSATLAL
jgi:hypothetical protein